MGKVQLTRPSASICGAPVGWVCDLTPVCHGPRFAAIKRSHHPPAGLRVHVLLAVTQGLDDRTDADTLIHLDVERAAGMVNLLDPRAAPMVERDDPPLTIEHR